jgi:hypothetical protein
LDVTVDVATGWEKLLRLARRFETLHLPFSSPRRSARILSPIVQAPIRAVFRIGQQSAPCDAVGAQTIGDDALGLVLQSLQHALEEPLGSDAIAVFLHQNVRHLPC